MLEQGSSAALFNFSTVERWVSLSSFFTHAAGRCVYGWKGRCCVGVRCAARALRALRWAARSKQYLYGRLPPNGSFQKVRRIERNRERSWERANDLFEKAGERFGGTRLPCWWCYRRCRRRFRRLAGGGGRHLAPQRRSCPTRPYPPMWAGVSPMVPCAVIAWVGFVIGRFLLENYRWLSNPTSVSK